MSQTVRINQVTKIYDNQVRAVDQVSLDIQEGEFFTLLGPSGCGKTTLLRMIAGFNSIEEGDIFFNQQRINDIPAHLRNIGMVFQNYAIFPHMSVRDNVAYGLKARRLDKQSIKQRAQEAMELMAILPYASRQPSQLSGGQQQRVALARAIVIHPAVMLMDEPLSNLDAKLRVQMRSSIKKLQMNLNITTIYVTHDQEEALAISDRIAIMNNGRLEQVGTPEEVYTRPSNLFVAGFVGTSAFLDGEAREGVVSLLGAKRYPCAIDPAFAGPVSVAVRPEKLSISEEQSGEISGVINMNTFLGSFINYEIQLDQGPVIEAKDSEHLFSRRPIGQRVSLQIHPKDMLVFCKQTGRSLMLWDRGDHNEHP